MVFFARASALLVVLFLSFSVLGMSLEEAKGELEYVKQQGYVGEKPTGYLGVVRPGKQAEEVVRTINQARREEYKRIAEKHGIAVTKVEAVAGKKAVERTPEGQYVMLDGEWVKK